LSHPVRKKYARDHSWAARDTENGFLAVL